MFHLGLFCPSSIAWTAGCRWEISYPGGKKDQSKDIGRGISGNSHWERIHIRKIRMATGEDPEIESCRLIRLVNVVNQIPKHRNRREAHPQMSNNDVTALRSWRNWVLDRVPRMNTPSPSGVSVLDHEEMHEGMTRSTGGGLGKSSGLRT